MASRPSPGSAKMVSVSTAPLSNRPSCSPTSVTTGSSALRSACRLTTRRSARPFARAVRMKSSPRTSSIVERPMRAMAAMAVEPSATAGSTRCRTLLRTIVQLPATSPSSSGAPVIRRYSRLPSMMPPRGNQPSMPPNTSSRRIPVQNTGIETPTSTPTIDPVSSAERGYRAASTPMRSPTTTANASAARLNCTVTGSAWPISHITGWRVRIEIPKSPRRTPARNRTYWTYTGRSSPSWWRIRCKSASVPLSPSSNWATSPGMRCIPKKTRTLTPSNTGASCSRRRLMNFSIAFQSAGRSPGPAGATTGNGKQETGNSSSRFPLPVARFRPSWGRQAPRIGTADLRPPLLQRNELHMEEHLQRVEQEAFHVCPRRAHLVGVVHEDPGRVVVQQLVGLLVQLLALSLVRGAAGVTEQPVVRRIVMARGVVGPRPAFGDVPLEEVAQEVIRVAIVARPSGDGKPFPRLVAEPVQIRPPLVLRDLDVDANLGEIPLHGLTEFRAADRVVAARVPVHHHVGGEPIRESGFRQ